MHKPIEGDVRRCSVFSDPNTKKIIVEFYDDGGLKQEAFQSMSAAAQRMAAVCSRIPSEFKVVAD